MLRDVDANVVVRADACLVLSCVSAPRRVCRESPASDRAFFREGRLAENPCAPKDIGLPTAPTPCGSALGHRRCFPPKLQTCRIGGAAIARVHDTCRAIGLHGLHKSSTTEDPPMDGRAGRILWMAAYMPPPTMMGPAGAFPHGVRVLPVASSVTHEQGKQSPTAKSLAGNTIRGAGPAWRCPMDRLQRPWGNESSLAARAVSIYCALLAAATQPADNTNMLPAKRTTLHSAKAPRRGTAGPRGSSMAALARSRGPLIVALHR